MPRIIAAFLLSPAILPLGFAVSNRIIALTVTPIRLSAEFRLTTLVTPRAMQPTGK